MKILEDAFQERNKKINKIELLKQKQKALDFWNDFEIFCNKGYDNLSDVHEKHLLKCFGIYDKGDVNNFTIRIRIPFGQFTALQAKKIAQTSKKYGKSCIDITTRSQIEFRHLKLHELPIVLKELESVGITTFQTAGDNFRGVITSPLDGYSKTSLINCESYFNDIQDVFLKNEEYIGTLPRKFNTGILGDTVNDCNIYGQDCAFVLASKDEELGFNLYLGGKVGVQARALNLFIKPSQVKTVFKTIVDLFKEYGFRDNRNKNRMTYFLDEISIEEFEKAIIKTSKLELKTAGFSLVKDEYKIDDSSTIKLKDNKTAVYFSIPTGIFNAEELEVLSTLMEKTNSIIRLTHEQSFFIITDDENVQLIKDSIIYKRFDSFHNIYFNNQIACAGANECSFGVISNKSDAIEMALYLNTHIPIENAKIRMYWSACPKGCGVHGVADIGFEGAKVKDENGKFCDGVKIFIGGKATTSVLEARQLTKAIAIPKAQEVIKELLNIYKTNRVENESFESFDSRFLSTLSIEQIHKSIGL
jgi:ferredoxin-nitrite reductase